MVTGDKCPLLQKILYAGPKRFDKRNPESGPTRKPRSDLQLCRSQPKTFHNRKIFRELNNVTLAELPSQLIRQTPV